MALTAGTISLVNKYADKLDLATTAATGGTGAENYTYEWHISKTSSFSPDSSNKVVDASASLTATITGLIPGQTYYVVCVVYDAGASGSSANSSEYTVSTLPQQYEQNQFTQTPALGQVDKRYSINTISAIAGEDLVTGQAVKFGSDDKVHACTANTDRVDGFIVFNPIHTKYSDGDALEIARGGSYITLRATSTLSAGDPVALDPTCIGGVCGIQSTEPPVGQAQRTITSEGQTVIVYLACPAL